MEQYVILLRSLYGFYAPLQDLIFRHVSPAHLPDVASRRSAALILDDLETLGEDTRNLERCTSLPQVSNGSQAFGALYVLEGSSLGGRIISRMMKSKENLPLESGGLRFFEGYGKETGEKWKAFVEALNKQPEHAAIVAAANQTFQSFQNWMIRTIHYEPTC